uniref:Uncharacterized protein n=1 Tax=Vespula pensylvanica TaxID=30213 RepID=A0A834UB89_VESPE|nr:hypothetical protein H0235_007214 [Vespula pensylvanica]
MRYPSEFSFALVMHLNAKTMRDGCVVANATATTTSVAQTLPIVSKLWREGNLDSHNNAHSRHYDDEEEEKEEKKEEEEEEEEKEEEEEEEEEEKEEE